MIPSLEGYDETLKNKDRRDRRSTLAVHVCGTEKYSAENRKNAKKKFKCKQSS